MPIWKLIQTTPIPIDAGRIWLRENTGDYTPGWSWTWPVLRYGNLGRSQQWMPREQGESKPPSKSDGKTEASHWQLKSIEPEATRENN